jgi:hypothetical protein
MGFLPIRELLLAGVLLPVDEMTLAGVLRPVDVLLLPGVLLPVGVILPVDVFLTGVAGPTGTPPLAARLEPGRHDVLWYPRALLPEPMRHSGTAEGVLNDFLPQSYRLPGIQGDMTNKSSSSCGQ